MQTNCNKVLVIYTKTFTQADDSATLFIAPRKWKETENYFVCFVLSVSEQ